MSLGPGQDLGLSPNVSVPPEPPGRLHSPSSPASSENLSLLPGHLGPSQIMTCPGLRLKSPNLKTVDNEVKVYVSGRTPTPTRGFKRVVWILIRPRSIPRHPSTSHFSASFPEWLCMRQGTGWRQGRPLTHHSLQGQAASCLNFSVPLISCVTLGKLLNLSVDQFLTGEVEIITVPAVLSRFSCIRLFAAPGTVAHQASLSMGFPRKEYWSG